MLFPFSNGQLQADIARGACRPAVLESRALSYCGHDYTGDTVTVPVSILSAREQVPQTAAASSDRLTQYLLIIVSSESTNNSYKKYIVISICTIQVWCVATP